MKKQLLMAWVVCFGLACAVEAVTIENVAARQRYPWNGLVDISFEVADDPAANVPEGKVVELSIAMTDQATGKRYKATNVTGDIEPTEGWHQIVWDLTAQGLEVYAPNAVFSVACEEKDSLYRVIDVSGGSTSEQYPVSFLNAVPEGSWSDVYKMDKIVLRRIDGANGVYYAGVFEITEAQWDKVMGGSSTSTKPKASASYNAIRGDAGTYDWPTSDAVAADSFMGRLRQKTGLATLDLPSADEWGYAARAGVTTEWLCGDSEAGLDDYAWYSANSGYETHPVGTLRANDWGLYDVHGNVWEWCLDRWWSGSRVLRGGSYGGGASDCAFSYRLSNRPSDDWDGVGFRLFCRPGSNDDDDDDGHGGSEIICEAESPATFVDLRRGVRYDSGTNLVHTLNWDAAWVGGDASAEVVIADGDTELARVTGAGSCVWTNTAVGLHTLTYTTFVGGVAQPEVYTANYFCLGEAGVSHVTARRILPWAGLVEISYDLSEGVEALSQVANLFTQVRMTDLESGECFVARTFTRPLTYEKGRHVLVWDASADGVSLKTPSASFSVAGTGEKGVEPLYRVIDVSGGPDAAHYPVASLDAGPTAGWTDVHKTDKIVLRRIDGTNGVYYAGVFEITEAQWDKVMGGASTSTRPKGSVSYNTIRGDAGTYDWPSSDAVAADSFMGRLRQKTGLATLDLPTEAEWEYAARAGVTTALLCGDSETGLGDYAWYSANSGYETHPVGTRRKNDWGLYDVHGNVWEWCLNRYYSDSGDRVLRGGSCYYGASSCAFSYRDSSGWRDNGFRLFCRPGAN